MDHDIAGYIDAVEAAFRSAASLYGADDICREEDTIRFQGEDGVVDWEARAQVVSRTAGGREGEEGRLRGSDIGENCIERDAYAVRVTVTAAYDYTRERIVDRYAQNGVTPDQESVEDILEQAYERLPRS